jgi:hypothetical protein
MSNIATQKHRALIEIKIEVYDVLDSGEFSGHPTNLSQHSEYGLKKLNYHQIEGFDKHDCLTKAKKWLEDIKKC